MNTRRHELTQLVWTQIGRKSRESQMDIETSVSLRCHLLSDFTNAKSWDDLIGRLREKGFHLRFDQERLTLVCEHTGVHLCTCRFLGYGFARLTHTLGKPHVHAGSKKVVTTNFGA